MEGSYSRGFTVSKDLKVTNEASSIIIAVVCVAWDFIYVSVRFLLFIDNTVFVCKIAVILLKTAAPLKKYM